MTDTNMMDIHVTGNPAEKEDTNAGETSAMVSLTYIFSQIKSIHEKTDYLHEAIHALSQMPDGDSGESYSPGNIMGEQRARALGDIVRCRETTNQQLLDFYMTVYNDMKSQS